MPLLIVSTTCYYLPTYHESVTILARLVAKQFELYVN